VRDLFDQAKKVAPAAAPASGTRRGRLSQSRAEKCGESLVEQ
jgi:hypothetical protein